MGKLIREYYPLLVESVSTISEVLSIGKSGGEKLPEGNESDIDIFVFCSQIPEPKARKAAIGKLGDAVTKATVSETGGKYWGTIDFLDIEDTEISLMYFTIASMNDEIESVLDGKRIEKEAGFFYPTGRCATMLSMHILYDQSGYMAEMKEKLSVYPQSLSEKLMKHHIERVNDTESFERAVARADVLFYHATLETALDHFLQALFALNQCFFPSRKRTVQFIDTFDIKPPHCAERLQQTIELGAKAETLVQSYEVWVALCKDLLDLIRLPFQDF